MAIFLESDREVTINGVGLLMPGEPVEVDEYMFEEFNGVPVTEANFPSFITVKDDSKKIGIADIVNEEKEEE